MRRVKTKFPKARKEILHEYNPLEEIEEITGDKYSGKLHALADKPRKFPKKVIGSKKESYRPLGRR